MTRARRAIGPIAALWLLCQSATLVLAPTLLSIGPPDATACTCIHGAEATCPMHHKTAAGAKVCAMRGLSQAATATLRSLLGLTGLMPIAASSTAPAAVAGWAPHQGSTVTPRPSPPEPPPPRV